MSELFSRHDFRFDSTFVRAFIIYIFLLLFLHNIYLLPTSRFLNSSGDIPPIATKTYPHSDHSILHKIDQIKKIEIYCHRETQSNTAKRGERTREIFKSGRKVGE